MANPVVTHSKVTGGAVDTRYSVDLADWDAGHVVTGLENVENTSDANKPVSTATQTALDLKADDADLTTHVGDTANPHSVTATQVGLGNVDNTSDATKNAAAVTLTNKTIDGATVTGVVDVGGATSFELPNDAAPTVNANGEIAVDTSVTDFSHGIIKYYSGEELGVVAMPVAEFTTPSNGAVPTYNSTNDEFELIVPAGSGTVTSVATAGLATGGPITVTGTVTVTAATQSNQETATSTTTAVTPAVQHYHPSACKAWVKAGVSGNVIVSYNVTSFTDGGTGLGTVVWNVDFSGADYGAFVTVVTSGTLLSMASSQAAGSMGLTCANVTPALADPVSWLAGGFGDQA